MVKSRDYFARYYNILLPDFEENMAELDQALSKTANELLNQIKPIEGTAHWIILFALAQKGKEGLDPLVEALYNPDYSNPYNIAEPIGRVGTDEAFEVLNKALEDERLQEPVFRALYVTGDERFLSRLTELLKTNKWATYRCLPENEQTMLLTAFLAGLPDQLTNNRICRALAESLQLFPDDTGLVRLVKVCQKYKIPILFDEPDKLLADPQLVNAIVEEARKKPEFDYAGQYITPLIHAVRLMSVTTESLLALLQDPDEDLRDFALSRHKELTS